MRNSFEPCDLLPSEKVSREAMAGRKPYSSSSLQENFFFFPGLKNGQDHLHLPHLHLPVFFSLRDISSSVELETPLFPSSDGNYKPTKEICWYKMNYVWAPEPFSSNKLQEEKKSVSIISTSQCIVTLSLHLYISCFKVASLMGSQLCF